MSGISFNASAAGTLLVGRGQMLFNGLLHIAAGKRLHHNAPDAKADYHLQIPQLGRARENDHWQVRLCAANVR